MHEKASLLMTEEIDGTPKLEQMCLQALSMRLFPGRPTIEISIDINLREEDQNTCTTNSKDCTIPVAPAPALSDSDLPQIVSTLFSADIKNLSSLGMQMIYNASKNF